MIGRRLEEAGFEAVPVDYPSRHLPVEELSAALDPVVERVGTNRPMHAVTHSMGGILLRWYVEHRRPLRLGRVVMLAPPGGGSELADELARWSVVRRLAGPALAQMGVGPASVPGRLGPPPFELGVIAGDHSLNPVFSALLPGADDGKVPVARARVEGMKEFRVVPCSHTWIMFDDEVARMTVRFLRSGAFGDPRAGP